MNKGNKSSVGMTSYDIKDNNCLNTMKAIPGNCTFTKVKYAMSCKPVIFCIIKPIAPFVKNDSTIFTITAENVVIGITFSSIIKSIVSETKSSPS